MTLYELIITIIIILVILSLTILAFMQDTNNIADNFTIAQLLVHWQEIRIDAIQEGQNLVIRCEKDTPNYYIEEEHNKENINDDKETYQLNDDAMLFVDNYYITFYSNGRVSCATPILIQNIQHIFTINARKYMGDFTVR